MIKILGSCWVSTPNLLGINCNGAKMFDHWGSVASLVYWRGVEHLWGPEKHEIPQPTIFLLTIDHQEVDLGATILKNIRSMHLACQNLLNILIVHNSGCSHQLSSSCIPVRLYIYVSLPLCSCGRISMVDCQTTIFTGETILCVLPVAWHGQFTIVSNKNLHKPTWQASKVPFAKYIGKIYPLVN